MKKTILLVFLCTIFISYYIYGRTLELNWDMPIEMMETNFSSGEYLFANTIEASFTFKLPNKLPEQINIQHTLTDPHGQQFKSPVQLVEGDRKETITTYFSHQLYDYGTDLITGDYIQSLTIWLETPTERKVLLEETSNSLTLFHQIEQFETFNPEHWEIRQEFPLGRGLLLASQVSHDDLRKHINLRLNTNHFHGGEIRTKDTFQYGSFRTSMKVANAPGSITGFFLYAPPDFEHEVDIEVFNDSSGTIMFTMYKDGQEWNHRKTELGFDPTVNFHEYRFDVYQDNIAFYVDSILMEYWETPTSYEPMQLMINSWFPSWVPLGESPVTNPTTSIQWVSY